MSRIQNQNADRQGVVPLHDAQRETTGGASQRIFAVLERVALAERPYSVSDLALLLEVPKPTMHRIVRQLENDGLLIKETAGRGYEPGPRLCAFALNVLDRAMSNGPRHAILAALSREASETCNFGTISNGAVVYVDRVEAAWPLGLRYEVGSRVPIHCTSIGKLMLAHQPRRRREHILGAAPLYKYTDNTMTDLESLEAEFAAIRTQGYSIDNQEFLAGVICVAVPVRDRSGNVCAAVALSAPQARMSTEDARQKVDMMRAAAAKVEDYLTYASETEDQDGED